jgi:hypothetical protein
MNTIRTATLGLAALLLSGLAAAPSAQAEAREIRACTPNPEAWVNACISLTPVYGTVTAYTVDPSPESTRVCPVNDVCANVPVVLSLLAPTTVAVTTYMVDPTFSANADQVVQDACDVIGVVCAVLPALFQPAQESAALPHGLTFSGLGDVDADGVIDLVFFGTPEGDTIVLPVA